MAHILKKPTAENKGVLLLTHKEIAYFGKGLKQIRYPAVNNITNKFFPLDKFKSYYAKKFEQISQKYFIGEHFGWYHRDYGTKPFIDFYLCTESTVTFKEPGKVVTIPLSSSSFINKIFENKGYNKIYDVMCVSHSGKNKRLKDFVYAVRKLYDEGYKYRVLLINKESILENSKGHYVELEDDYHRLFSAEEKQLFTLVRIKGSLSLLGLPSQAISEFYNLSKVFALFSEQEGEPRAISEALICGLPVVMNENIRAGGVGLDMLTNENSVLFTDYAQSHDALIQAVENIDSFNIDSERVVSSLREDYTTEVFKEHLAKLYAKQGQVFDGKLDNPTNLANAVNAHITEVPWATAKDNTADICTKQQFDILYKELGL
ncbi:MAG: glycosyltransferase involved in cell wall biosynthesis [Bacteroidia bacterium]|jgi:glycosyltransferase involved in cell wall biosynthesis